MKQAVSSAGILMDEGASEGAVQAYARRLAYLGCAKKIKAATDRDFGKGSISLSACKDILQKRESAHAHFKRVNGLEPLASDDGHHWSHIGPIYVVDQSAEEKETIALPTMDDVNNLIAASNKRNRARLEAKLRPMRKPLGERLCEAAIELCGITTDEFYSSCRLSQAVTARACVAKTLREFDPEKYSLPAIARIIRRADHSTIRSLINTFEKRSIRYPEMKTVLAKLQDV